MYKSNNFCMICGKHLSESHSDDICSENCNDDFNDFKNNADLTSINGFCNFCGEFHELKKDSFYGVILHRHNKCYPANSYYSKSPLQIEKEREGKEELRRKQKEEEEELRRKQKEEEELRRKQKEEEELRRNFLLSNKKVYDFDSNLLFCSYCNTYSVEYSNKINEWTCNKCNRHIVMENNQSPYPFAYGMYRSLEFNFTNEDKYKIYKYYGIESLVKLTGDSRDEIKEVIGSYFEKGCTSIGDNCLYYGHFKEANAAKQIRLIDDLFDKSKQDCNLLRNEIYSFLDSVEDIQLHLSEAQQKLLDTEYVSIKQTIEALYEQIEDYLIAVANTDIKKGEKVFLREKGTDLLADIGGETFDGFCWNYAKKGSFVGICTIPSYALNQTKQMFENFMMIFEESNDIITYKKRLHEFYLSSLEHETISLIIQNDGILQSSLRKQLGIDSKKCSRLVNKLMDKKLIHRIPEIYSGRNTYRILINCSQR